MYMYISKKCGQLRAEDENLKTQLRFGSRGLEILTKDRNEPGPFRAAKDLMDVSKIPQFDHSKKWTYRGDCAPRRN